ncbi:FecCD family ABC transporter permease [Nocardioides caldifontis]|uniref:FecCD family ABC transporter permease n=1 Tax=Nocardioides caldifontis TaxID=2588938 RepID=UPI0011DF0500|nr:iron chelate uptake ABC transporter family permease subunit [Nocardioides caldifontis]
MATLEAVRPDAVTLVRTARRRPRRRHALVIAGLSLLLLGVLTARVLLGDFTVTIPDFFRILFGETIPGASYIVMEVKLPRALLGLLAGMAFGVGGAIFQATLRNPLASPDILGMNLGASAAAVFAIVVLDMAGVALSVAAVLGGIGVALLVRWAAGNRQGPTGAGYRLVLVGVGAAAALQSVIQYLFTRTDVHDAQLVLRWLTGSVSAADWETVRVLTLLLVVAVPLVAWAARSLPVVELGADAATGLGVRPVRSDVLLLIGVTVVAVAVAAAGPVAFVSFLAAPIARAVNAGATTLLGSALVGAIVVVGSDFAADYWMPGGNYPVGVVTGAVGAPFLLWLLTRGRTGRSGS